MFVLCVVETFFDREQDQSMCRVSKPLQVFNTKEEAEVAEELFGSFYDYNLRVVAAHRLGEEFR